MIVVAPGCQEPRNPDRLRISVPWSCSGVHHWFQFSERRGRSDSETESNIFTRRFRRKFLRQGPTTRNHRVPPSPGPGPQAAHKSQDSESAALFQRRGQVRLSVGAQARSAGGPGVWVWWPDSETDSDFTAPSSPPPGSTVTLVDVQSAGEPRISAGLEVQAREPATPRPRLVTQ